MSDMVKVPRRVVQRAIEALMNGVGALEREGAGCGLQRALDDALGPIAAMSAPPPAADAVSEAMTDAAMRQMRAVCGVERMSREQMWAVLDAALAARSKE